MSLDALSLFFDKSTVFGSASDLKVEFMKKIFFLMLSTLGLSAASVKAENLSFVKNFECENHYSVVLKNTSSSNEVSLRILKEEQEILNGDFEVLKTNMASLNEIGENMTYLDLRNLALGGSVEVNSGLIPIAERRYKLRTAFFISKLNQAEKSFSLRDCKLIK